MPKGIHQASWKEIVDVLGFSTRRAWLLEGLQDALAELARSGCRLAYLDGSFVTEKRDPGDYDLCWEMDGVDIAGLDPILTRVTPPRAEQHAKYRGDILPNLVEESSGVPLVDYFQLDKETGESKGIAALDPRCLP
ncbi:MAG: hypothetical protein F4X58_06500 [Chloroflexi bacterium]|nr:hypothetical protein [Chloroflexota bacterium]MYC01553.1 hypothetical protein [Chloroflexota bacterium]